MKISTNSSSSIRLSYPFLLKLCYIIPSYIIGLFYHEKNRTGLFLFPKKVHGYIFVKQISKKTYPFAVGLYKSNTNELFVLKFWQGKIKNIFYFSFLHEYQVYLFLNEMMTKYKKKLPQKFQNIFFPEVVEICSYKQFTIVVRKYISGTLCKNCKVSEQIKLYKLTVDFLQFFSNILSEKDQQKIKTKKRIHFFGLYPLLLTASLWRNPQYRKDLLLATVCYFLLFPFVRYKKLGIVHGDLHNENLLVTSNKVFILDCEQMMRTYPLYEYITTLASFRTVGKFRNFVWDKVLSNTTPDDIGHLRCLLINNSVHNLTGTTIQKSIEKNIRLLRIALLGDKSVFIKMKGLSV